MLLKNKFLNAIYNGYDIMGGSKLEFGEWFY